VGRIHRRAPSTEKGIAGEMTAGRATPSILARSPKLAEWSHQPPALASLVECYATPPGTIAPYAFGSSLDGTLAVRGRDAEVDLSASDLLDQLELGFMGMAVARKGDWGVVGDALWVELGQNADFPDGPPPQPGMAQADVDTDLTIVTVEGLYTPRSSSAGACSTPTTRAATAPTASRGTCACRARRWDSRTASEPCSIAPLEGEGEI
jgi:hypothetical protein